MKIEDIKEKALEVLLRYGTHSPIIFVSGTNADAMILLDELPDEHFESRKYLFRKGAETAKVNTVGVLLEAYLASEAWVSVGKPGGLKPVAPVKDLQRTEALVVYSIDVVSKQQRLVMFSLKRDPAGAVREIAPFQGKEELQAVSNPFLMTFIAGFASIALSRKK